MSLISKAISHLFGGVSQQAAALRDSTQCELMENCWPEVAEGLGKRPPVVHVAKLNTDVTTNRKVHLINRDGGEQYVVTLKNNEVKVYDRLTGTAKTVTTPDGVGYLASSSPVNDFSLLTVADTTFIVNKTKVTTLDAALPDGSTRQWATVTFNSMPTNKALCTSSGYIRVTVRGVNFDSYTDSSAVLGDHINNLASRIQNYFGWANTGVTTDGATYLHIYTEPGGTLTCTATTYDETDNGSACTGVVANPSRVTVTTGSDNASTVAFVSIDAAVSRQSYSISLTTNGGDNLQVSATVAADGSDAQTTTIAGKLSNAVNYGTSVYFGWFTPPAPVTAYIAWQAGSVLKIARRDGLPFDCRVWDSYGDQGMHTFVDSVENPTQLPPNFWPGYTIKVRGAINAGQDDYYVTFDYGNQNWKETVKPAIQNVLTASTMPHKLVRQADGTFIFSKITWLTREVGDEESNPAPSFLGRAINNVFFFRERLGFLSGENIVMSRVADYYNFWNSTASGVLDDDPIDVSVADVKVSYLYHAVPFQDSLLLFSDSAQYQLTGGDVLSASTVRLEPTTRFSASKTLAPTAAGRNVFFAVNKGAYSSLREYFVTPGNAAYSDALDVTAHVPSYVPQGLVAFEASSLTDALFAVSSTVPNAAYCYKFLWDGDKKVQSSWGKWVLDTGATILNLGFTDTVLTFVVVRSDGTYIETCNLQTNGVETGMDRLVYLDRRVSLTGAYNSTTKKTTWTLPFSDTGTFNVVLGAGFGGQAGISLSVTKESNTTVSANGNYSAFSCFVGKPYTMRYRFSELFIKDRDNTALQSGRLQLRTMTVPFSKTGYFRVEVTPPLREMFTYQFTARMLGGITALIGSNPILTDKHRFPVAANSHGVTIDLVNDSPSPSFFQGAEWEGLYTQRAKRA